MQSIRPLTVLVCGETIEKVRAETTRATDSESDREAVSENCFLDKDKTTGKNITST